MILPDPELASLKSALHCWEWFGYISTAVVGLGCIGEYVSEFTSIPTGEQCKHKISRLSLIVLILGIAGELLSTARTSQLSGQLIANTEEHAAKAEKEAGEANDRASANEREAAQLRKDSEGLKSENLKLEAIISPRSLSLDQQRRIADVCRKFHDHLVLVKSYGTDGEGSALAAQVMATLKTAHIAVADSRGAEMVTGQFDVGVHVRGPDTEREFASTLANALRTIGKLEVAPVNDPEPRVGAVMGGGGQVFTNPRAVFVTLRVGIKPLPVLRIK